MRQRRGSGVVVALAMVLALALDPGHSAASSTLGGYSTALDWRAFAGPPHALDPNPSLLDDDRILPPIATDVPGIPCYPSTSTSPVVKVFYLYYRGTTNQLSRRKTAIREAIGYADLTYALSAKRTRGTRHVRWLMSAECKLSITAVAIDPNLDFHATRRYLTSKGLLKSNHKAVAFREGSPCMGLGDRFDDDRASSANRNNRGGTLAWVFINPCLDEATDLLDRHSVFASLGFGIAHELAHSLGAVQKSAPHATDSGHCTDGHDILCYRDGPGVVIQDVCMLTVPALFDCGNDDYFHTKPRAGSYLATHWNIARSRFLATTEPTKWDLLPRGEAAFSTLTDGATLDTGTPIEVLTTKPTDSSSIAGVALVVANEYAGYQVVAIDRVAPFAPAFRAPWSSPGGAVIVRGVAFDTLGRQTSTASLNVIVGSQRPAGGMFAITTPPNNAGVTGPFNLTVAFPTGSALSSATIYVNGLTAGSVTASQPSALIDPALLGLEYGDLVVTAVAGDGSGLEAEIRLFYLPL